MVVLQAGLLQQAKQAQHPNQCYTCALLYNGSCEAEVADQVVQRHHIECSSKRRRLSVFQSYRFDLPVLSTPCYAGDVGAGSSVYSVLREPLPLSVGVKMVAESQ